MANVSDRRKWIVLLAAWLSLVCMVAYEIVPASVFPPIRQDLGIGPAAASWLVSAMYLAMMLLSIPAGLLLDRVDNRAVIVVATVGLFATSVWAWVAGTAGDYYALLASRFLAGAALTTAWTGSVNVVGEVFSADRQGTAIGALSTCIPAGLAAGQFLGPALQVRVGWAATFPALGGFASLAVLAFWASTRDVSLRVGSGTPPTRREFSAVLTQRSVLAVSVVAFCAFSLTVLFNSWMPTYIVDRFDVSLQFAGVLTAVFPLVGLVSRGLSGFVSDRYFGSRRRPIVITAFAVALPAVAATGLVGSVVLLVVALLAAGFAIQLGLALLFTYVRELVAANVVGTALAVLNTTGFLGAFLGPVLAGTLLEATGSFLPTFAYATLLCAVGLWLAIAVPESG